MKHVFQRNVQQLKTALQSGTNGEGYGVQFDSPLPRPAYLTHLPLSAPLYTHQEHKARDARIKSMRETNWWVGGCVRSCERGRNCWATNLTLFCPDTALRILRTSTRKAVGCENTQVFRRFGVSQFLHIQSRAVQDEQLAQKPNQKASNGGYWREDIASYFRTNPSHVSISRTSLRLSLSPLSHSYLPIASVA